MLVDETIAAATFISFVTALFLASDPARRLAQLDFQLHQHLVEAEFIYAVLDTRAEITDAPMATALKITEGEVKFEDVDLPTMRPRPTQRYRRRHRGGGHCGKCPRVHCRAGAGL